MPNVLPVAFLVLTSQLQQFSGSEIDGLVATPGVPMIVQEGRTALVPMDARWEIDLRQADSVLASWSGITIRMRPGDSSQRSTRLHGFDETGRLLWRNSLNFHTCHQLRPEDRRMRWPTRCVDRGGGVSAIDSSTGRLLWTRAHGSWSESGFGLSSEAGLLVVEPQSGVVTATVSFAPGWAGLSRSWLEEEAALGLEEASPSRLRAVPTGDALPWTLQLSLGQRVRHVGDRTVVLNESRSSAECVCSQTQVRELVSGAVRFTLSNNLIYSSALLDGVLLLMETPYSVPTNRTKVAISAVELASGKTLWSKSGFVHGSRACRRVVVSGDGLFIYSPIGVWKVSARSGSHRLVATGGTPSSTKQEFCGLPGKAKQESGNCDCDGVFGVGASEN